MTFAHLGLCAEILRALDDRGYNEPTPVQAQAIPAILQGHDVMAGAQTGTGKTAGFTLPLLQRLNETKPHTHTQTQTQTQTSNSQRNRKRPHQQPVRALILTPTRELAAQVSDSVSAYSQNLPIRSTVVFGGVKINPQMIKLKRGVDVLVATPGRLLDLASQNAVNLSQVEILVLDEADRMLDMGFIRDIRKILALLPSKRQNLLFSATFSKEIKGLCKNFLNNPIAIEVGGTNNAAELVTQKIYPVDRNRKRELLSYIIGSKNWQQVLVFTRTKHAANRLAKQLSNDGLEAAAIHGNKSQGARTRALKEFKEGQIQVLVATDIAARGLDIKFLPYVVNFELPNVAEDYVHRIGRTGRASSPGEAISLVCTDENKDLRGIEKMLGQQLPRIIEPGYEVTRAPSNNKPRNAPARSGKPVLQGQTKKRTSNQNKNNSGNRRKRPNKVA